MATATEPLREVGGLHRPGRELGRVDRVVLQLGRVHGGVLDLRRRDRVVLELRRPDRGGRIARTAQGHEQRDDRDDRGGVEQSLLREHGRPPSCPGFRRGHPSDRSGRGRALCRRGRHLPRPGRNRHAVLGRREGAAPARVVRARRVVGVVEVQHQAAPPVPVAEVGALDRVEQVAAAAVGLAAGEGVAEGQEQAAAVALEPVDGQARRARRPGPGARSRCA